MANKGFFDTLDPHTVVAIAGICATVIIVAIACDKKVDVAAPNAHVTIGSAPGGAGFR